MDENVKLAQDALDILKKFGEKSYTKPYCYNCNKNEDNNICCENQEQPDYAFDFDNNDRWQHKDQLKNKGLKWSQHND